MVNGILTFGGGHVETFKIGHQEYEVRNVSMLRMPHAEGIMQRADNNITLGSVASGTFRFVTQQISTPDAVIEHTFYNFHVSHDYISRMNTMFQSMIRQDFDLKLYSRHAIHLPDADDFLGANTAADVTGVALLLGYDPVSRSRGILWSLITSPDTARELEHNPYHLAFIGLI